MMKRVLGAIRDDELSPDELARIEACDDVLTLERWTLRVPAAKSPAALFED